MTSTFFPMNISNTSFVVRIMRKEDVKDVTEVIVRSFNSPSHPLAFNNKLDWNVYNEFIKLLVECVVHNNLSLVAVDSISDEIVGVQLVCDQRERMRCLITGEDYPKNEEMERFVQTERFIDSFLHQYWTLVEIADEYSLQSAAKNKIQNVIQAYHACVVPEARGKGILRYLQNGVVQIAKENKVDFFFAVATSIFSTRVFKSRYETAVIWKDFYYDDFEYTKKKTGEKIFPLRGCNEYAVESLKRLGKYKEVYKGEICKKCTVIFIEIGKESISK